MTDISNAKNLATEGKQVPEWTARPFQLVSLLKMIERFGYGFYHTGALLEKLITISKAGQYNAEDQLEDESIKTLKDTLKKMENWCKSVGLELSIKGIRRIHEMPTEEFKLKALQLIFGELERRVEDELSSVLFMYIPPHRAGYYQTRPLFNEKVAKKFPKATEDIEEAGKCFAVARYTACVFHLMRVMERGVQRLGKKLNVSIPVEEKDWGAIGNRINGAIKQLPNSTTQEKRIHTRYTKVATYLDNVRESWRNPTMHTKETYTEEE